MTAERTTHRGNPAADPPLCLACRRPPAQHVPGSDCPVFVELPRFCPTCGGEHGDDRENGADCARCAEVNAEWAAALGPGLAPQEAPSPAPCGALPAVVARHGFTPGRFSPDTCQVVLARYPCPYTREQHPPGPPADIDVFGYTRGQL